MVVCEGLIHAPNDRHSGASVLEGLARKNREMMIWNGRSGLGAFVGGSLGAGDVNLCTDIDLRIVVQGDAPDDVVAHAFGGFRAILRRLGRIGALGFPRTDGCLVLDKTVPYFNVIMTRRPGLALATSELPPEYSWQWFGSGDEVHWASIEASVGEFSTAGEALEYFRHTYLPDVDEVARRCVFVRAANGDRVGTITSWWNETGNRRDPSVHWLAVRPEYQGLGLGRALVGKSLQQLSSLEGDRAVWLHTQTWSHRAIAIYIKAGFEFVRQESFGDYTNDYEKAMPVLAFQRKRNLAPEHPRLGRGVN